ncbi:kinase-like domain, phloem protein 2-like protein [Tanacetum coccineum]
MLQGQKSDHFKLRYLERAATGYLSHMNSIQVSESYSLGEARLSFLYKKYSMEMKGDNNSELPTELSTVVTQIFTSIHKEKIEAMFCKEIPVLIKYKHHNIVSLLGYSADSKVYRRMLFFYEHPSNGSLADHLGSNRNITNFTWVKRIKICIDIAEGLKYIHTSPKYNESNLRRTISSRNILLKENWEAVIGVFSEFKPPEPILDDLADWYMPTDSSLTYRKEIDIFHFGIVLFEILCWRFADNPIYRRNNDKGLVSFVRRCFKDGTRNEILDLKLKGEEEKSILSKGIDDRSLDTFSEIAYRCLGGNHSQPRPTTEVILKELKRALCLQVSNI